MSVATVSRVLNGKGPGPRGHGEAHPQRRPAPPLRSARRRAEPDHAPHAHASASCCPISTASSSRRSSAGSISCARRNGYHVLVSGSHGDREETEAMIRAMRGRVDGLIVLVSERATERAPGEPARKVSRGAPEQRVREVRSTRPHSTTSEARRPWSGTSSRSATGGSRSSRARPGTATRPSGFAAIARRSRAAGAAWSERLEMPGRLPRAVGLRRSPVGSGRCRPGPPRSSRRTTRWRSASLHAFREKGVSVPEELAIAGFDDIPIARFITPPLTSVRVPIAELGNLRGPEADREARRNRRRDVRRRDTLLPTDARRAGVLRCGASATPVIRRGTACAARRTCDGLGWRGALGGEQEEAADGVRATGARLRPIGRSFDISYKQGGDP